MCLDSISYQISCHGLVIQPDTQRYVSDKTDNNQEKDSFPLLGNSFDPIVLLKRRNNSLQCLCVCMCVSANASRRFRALCANRELPEWLELCQTEEFVFSQSSFCG